MVRRTKEEAQETRNRLLDTAERVFNERGVSRTSLAEIAEAAGVTRGAIYWHFKNKLDLFNAMMERVTLPIEEMNCQLADAVLQDPLVCIRERSLSIMKSIGADAQIQRVFDIMSHKCEYVDEMAPLKDRHLESRRDCIAHVEEGFTNAVKMGLLPATVDPRHAAIGLHALIDGLIMNWLLDPEYFSFEKDAEPMIDIFFRGLAASAQEAAVKPKARVRAAASLARPGKPARKRQR